MLEQICESSMENISRSIDNLRDIETALETLVDSINITRYFNHVEIDRDAFENLPSACKFLILKKMLSIFNSDLELKRAHLENLPEKGIVKLKSAVIEVMASRVVVAKIMEEKEKELPLSDKIHYGYYNIETEVISPPANLKVENCEFFDMDCLELPLRVGKKKIGDRFVAFGSENRKKIKDIFINSKIPRVLRENYPIIYDRKGIILIPGIKRSNRAPVSEKTKTILKIKHDEVINAGEEE